jgi:hypothetical protein
MLLLMMMLMMTLMMMVMMMAVVVITIPSWGYLFLFFFWLTKLCNTDFSKNGLVQNPHVTYTFVFSFFYAHFFVSDKWILVGIQPNMAHLCSISAKECTIFCLWHIRSDTASTFNVYTSLTLLSSFLSEGLSLF